MSVLRASHRGFVLLLTLALVSLSLLLLLGLVAVIRLEAQATLNSAELAKARANARLGLRIAIGQLQRYTGSVDGVVTARADVAGGNWSNPAWTGVWNEANVSGAITWLVSGNEVSPLSLTPGVTLNGVHDLFILRRNLAVSEQVKVRKVSINATLSGRTSPNEIGRYAYWVSDESLKVSMNVRTDIIPPAEVTIYPVPRTQSVVSTISAAATNDSRAKLQVVDQLLLAPLNVNGNTLNNTLWPAVTASAPRLFFAGGGSLQLIPGSFNANSRSQIAWNAYLDNLTLTVSSATAYNAIRDASRPFRSVADFREKLSANASIGSVNAEAIVNRLAPVLGVRGDTFLVRAYGETLNPGLDATDSGAVTASAFCEAIVQRTTEQAGAFGYRYAVVYFRWLTPADI